jgi:putative ubiquitin-RnfH superfamily antitoxin RatB of RatAB toxin-antitoxin module
VSDHRPQKRCWVAFADAERQFLWQVVLAADATVAEAIEEARRQSGEGLVPWDSASVGIFGEARTRAARPQDGDRIELYRPLREDPRLRRRTQAAPHRKEGR